MRIITGEPGSSWVNNTGVVYWQLVTSKINVCGNCWAKEGKIALYWGYPFHRHCRCGAVPILPGETADPFPDYRQQFRSFDSSQHVNAVGRSNWLLIDRGIVAWDQVVLSTEVLPLHEVVARQKLTIADLVKAGIARHIAEQAWQTAHWTDKQKQDALLKKAAQDVAASGLSQQQLRRGLTGNSPGIPDSSMLGRDGPDRSLERQIIGGRLILATLWRGQPGEPPEPPDFKGSVPAMRKWVETMFPASAKRLTDDDWLALAAFVIACEEQRRILRKLGAKTEKAMQVIK